MSHASRLHRWALAAGTALLLAVVFFSFCPAGGPLAHPVKLTILHLNDIHGHYESYPEEGSPGLVGGLAKAKTVIDRIRQENRKSGRETFVLFAGDLFMGTVFSETSRGTLEAKLLNAIDFTAMTAGNHDFDYGLDALNRLKVDLNFPVLGANVKDEDFRHQFDLVKECWLNGTRVVLFGLTTQSSRANGLYFSDPIAAAKEILDRYESKDLIIAVTHLGDDKDRELLKACKKIDVIVGGHSHDKLSPKFADEPRPIVQAGAYTRFLGRLDLDVKDGEVVGYNSRMIDLNSDVKDDEQIAKAVAEYKQGIPPCWFLPIGRSEVYLEGTHRQGVSVDNPDRLGKLVAYVMALHSKAQIGMTNAGGIRWGILKGEITLSDIFQVLPFANRCVVLNIRGGELLDILRRSDRTQGGYGEVLQTYGLTLGRDDATRDMVIRKVRDEEFDPDKTYSVVVNDFLAAGLEKLGLVATDKKGVAEDEPLIRDLLADYIRDKKVITDKLLDELN